MLLKDLVNKSRVCFHDRFNNWEDAVRASCEPLIQDGSITTEYVDAVIGCVKIWSIYCSYATCCNATFTGKGRRG